MATEGTIELVADMAGERLDIFLARRRPDLSRSFLQKLIARRLAQVNGRPQRAAFKLSAGDHVSFTIPPAPPSRAQPEPIPLTIVYEDADLLVVDKPPGLVVHPAPGHAGGTLVNAVLAHVPELGEEEGLDDSEQQAMRPGIVHRLDKDTSGLLVVAKHERAQSSLAAQFRERSTEKMYLALLHGHLSPAEGLIDAPLGRDPRHRQRMALVAGGRPAQTGYRVVRYIGLYTLVEVYLYTGRTHQIRVHFAGIGYPVAGDPLYGKRDSPPGLRRQFLHAARLRLRLPGSGEPAQFESKLPEELRAVLGELEKKESSR